MNDSAAIRLTVLNPGGNDLDQAFPEGAGMPDDRVHAPVNFHAFAACTKGCFSSRLSRVPTEGPVMVLLRADLRASLEAVRKLKDSNRVVAISWKEAGLVQVSRQLQSIGVLHRFEEVCRLADGCVAVTPELVELYQAAGAKKTEIIPTPYPIDVPQWSFAKPYQERNGIFIGTRELDILSRNLASTLFAARRFGVRFTVIHTEGWIVRRKLAALGGRNLRIVPGPLPYSEYLREIAGHRLVIQHDRSVVPGQVAGDALLCGVPCLGGDGAVDRLLFPQAPDPERMMIDDLYYLEQISAAEARAREVLSFEAVRRELGRFFSGEPKKVSG